MNNLNRIKFLIKNLFSKSSIEDKIITNKYINNKGLRENAHYSLAITKLMECKSRKNKFANFLHIESLQKSKKFDLIIEKLFNKHTNDEFFISGLGSSYLSEKDRYDDIVLKGLEYTNKDNLHLFIQLCEYYYYFIDFDKNFKNVEFDSNKYKYMVEKFVTIKDDPIAKFYFRIFSKLELLESDEYTTFVDRVMEIKNKKELSLLNTTLDMCVKNYSNDRLYMGFYILDSLSKIEDEIILDKIYHIPEYLEIFCKLNYSDKSIYNILNITNDIINLLYNEKVVLFTYNIMDVLFNKVLSQKDNKVILDCLELLKHEIESNINTSNINTNLVKNIEDNTANLEKLIGSKLMQMRKIK